MSNDVSLQEAKEGLESLGMWMDTRHNSRFVGTPIQTWNISEKEKGFFTVYAMNLVIESDGFGSLVEQDTEDVDAFVAMLRQLGAKETSIFVQNNLIAWRTKDLSNEDECTSQYFALFEQEQIWLKLLEYIGRKIFMRYLLKAQQIENLGQSTFDPKQWEGDLPDKRWWEFWK